MSVETRIVQVGSLGSKKLTKLNGDGWRVVSSSHGLLGGIEVILERPRNYVPPPSPEDARRQARRQDRSDRWEARFERLNAAAERAKVERAEQKVANRGNRAEKKAAKTAAREARATAVPPQQVHTPAVWAPDPYGRHEWRYWDGHRWSEHVSNAGVVGLDASPTS